MTSCAPSSTASRSAPPPRLPAPLATSGPRSPPSSIASTRSPSTSPTSRRRCPTPGRSSSAASPSPRTPPSRPPRSAPSSGPAAGHGITELSILLTRRARLPRNVFSIRSLAILNLDTCAVPRWSQIACPCLRTLKLHRVAIHQETINQVLASASFLDTFEMIYCTGLGTGIGGGCAVESSSVRNLVFRPPLKQSEVTIRVPGLRTLVFYTRAKARSLELTPAPEIRKAYLHIAKPRRPMDTFKVRSFLDAATMLNCFTLRGLAVKVVFQNMRILSVSLSLSREREVVFLLKLLESCPNLQQLTLSAVNTDENKAAETMEDMAAETMEDMAAETFEDMAAETDDDMTAEAEDMPAETDENNGVPCFTDHKDKLTNVACLTTCLVEFTFLGFKPEEYEKSLVVFLLTRGKNLKKVGVQFEESQEAVVKEILSVRKAPAQRTFRKYGVLFVELDYS